MSRNQYYKYNPETDNFERVFPTLKRRMTAAVRYILVSLVVCACLFVIYFSIFDTPGERRLREENSYMKQQFEILNRRLDNAQNLIEHLQNRDDKFYRVMLQMDPVDHTWRYAGLNSDKRYRDLTGMSDGGIVKTMTQSMDMLERQIYAQSLSFDQIKEEAVKQKDKISHVPSILPVTLKDVTVSSGFGKRRDPVSGEIKIHPGIDFAAREGTPVYATANGRVSTARRANQYGNMVAIDHGMNYQTRYMHLSRIEVENGQEVKRGQIIGRVGSTGKSSGPHLHYEVKFRGEPQNPANFNFMDMTPEEYADFAAKAESAGDVME